MKVLIVGLGSIGIKHVKAIQSVLPSTEIYALRSSKEAEKVNGVINIFTLKDIKSNTIDFAIISNPTSEHKKTITELLEYNIPLFIEKPIYFTLDIEDLINSINKKEILTYVACNLRFLDCIKFIKKQLPLVKAQKINEVNVYCGSYLPDWRPNVDFRKVYSAIKELGGGVHLDLIHELDYLYWLFGKPKEVKRYCKNQSSISISSFDYANYILDYEGFCANVVLNYYRHDSKRSLELVLENETWYVDLLKNYVICNGQVLFSSEQNIADTYYLQMQYFMNCITGGEESFNTVNNAFDVLKICLEK